MRWLLAVFLTGCTITIPDNLNLTVTVGAGGHSDAGAAGGAGGAPVELPELAPEAGPAAEAAPEAGPVEATVDAPAEAAVLAGACPTVCNIMPLGDSITDGGLLGAVGYRPPLWHKNHALNFVGSLQSGPDTVDGLAWPRHHEGHSGWSIDVIGSVMTGLQVIAFDRITTYHPDVVLLMIGTNDIANMYDMAHAPDRLAHLIDTIFQAKPNTVLILSTILPTTTPSWNVLVDDYNAAMPGIVAAKRAGGFDIRLVDIHAAFVGHADWMADSLHPNDTGYAAMADIWFGVL